MSPFFPFLTFLLRIYKASTLIALPHRPLYLSSLSTILVQSISRLLRTPVLIDRSSIPLLPVTVNHSLTLSSLVTVDRSSTL